MDFFKMIKAPLKKIKHKVYIYKNREKTKSFGHGNPEILYYIIRRDSEYCGLFSWFITTIGHLRRAELNSYIAVIDMKNYKNPYISKKQLHKINAWEYYFEQPMGHSLEEAYEGQRVILSDATIIPDRPGVTLECLYNINGELDMWKQYVDKYIKIKPDILSIMTEEWNEYFKSNDKVLGVLCRGTDYVKNKPEGHPKQPSLDLVINKIYEWLNEYSYNKIFLATEDVGIYEILKKEFDSKLFINKKEFIEYSDGGINEYVINRCDDNYKRGFEYLTSIWMLSQCNALIAGQCGGSVGAVLLAPKYERIFFWDLGRY